MRIAKNAGNVLRHFPGEGGRVAEVGSRNTERHVGHVQRIWETVRRHTEAGLRRRWQFAEAFISDGGQAGSEKQAGNEVPAIKILIELSGVTGKSSELTFDVVLVDDNIHEKIAA